MEGKYLTVILPPTSDLTSAMAAPNFSVQINANQVQKQNFVKAVGVLVDTLLDNKIFTMAE